MGALHWAAPPKIPQDEISKEEEAENGQG